MPTFEDEMNVLIAAGFISPGQRHIAGDFIEDMIVRQVALRLGLKDTSIAKFNEMEYKATVQKEAKEYAEREISLYKQKYYDLHYLFDKKVTKMAEKIVKEMLQQFVDTGGDIHKDCY